jgi:TrmH family RNA methyltransferase
MKLIQSRENAQYKALVKLTGSARVRSRERQTVLDGVHLLTAYLDAGCKPCQVFFNAQALTAPEVNALIARLLDVPLTLLDDKLFDELSELKSTTGVLALIDLPVSAVPLSSCRFALVLEAIQDPGNLGSMLRSAAAAGCDAVFLSASCADAWSPKVLRAAMGGHFVLAIQEQQNLPALMSDFPGMKIATALNATQRLYDCDLSGTVVFMMGNEGAGLSDELLSLATHPVIIPMPGKVESLNVAAATAICLFEAVRQRG